MSSSAPPSNAPRHPYPVALVLGASRGIGRQIALTLSSAGYTVVVSSKTTSPPDSPTAGSGTTTTTTSPPDPNSPSSTITTVAAEITTSGGRALAIACDTRSPDSVAALFASAWQAYGRLDALIYNPGAIWWASVENTPLKRYQLMQAVNADGLYAAVQSALPLFAAQGWRGRVVVVCPPIYSRFFRGKTGYAMGKVAMSVLVKGLAMDWEREGKQHMAVCGVWPAVAVESAATQSGVRAEPELRRDLRKATVFADAVLGMLRAEVGVVNGLLDTDEDFLRRVCGVTDFRKYALVEGSVPRRIMPMVFPDLTVEEQNDEGRRVDSSKQKKGEGLGASKL